MHWFNTGHKQTDTKDSTASFVHNRTRENIKSGEKHSTLFGKIARYFEDLKLVAFTGSYNDLAGKPSIPAAVRVKGNAESSYRTGDVNLTPANIGAAAASHSHTKSQISDFPSTMPPSSHEHAQYAKKNTNEYYNLALQAQESSNGPNVINNASNGRGGVIMAGNGNRGSSGRAGLFIGDNNTISDGCDGCAAIGYGNTVQYNGYTNRGNVAIGNSNTVKGYFSSAALGDDLVADDYQLVIGHCNDSSLSPKGTSGGTQGTLFAIGNGYYNSRSNALRVEGTGIVRSKGAYNTTGADYAEYFEWLDGNASGEDRTGLFVTLEGDRIKLAGESDYILGVISANPSVVGNSDEHWQGQYKKDEFNRYVLQDRKETRKEILRETVLDADGSPVTDENGRIVVTEKEVEREYKATVYVENEGFDPDKGYTQRCDRPEWDTVGLLGQLVCHDDGTCKTNGYCKCSTGGIATAATPGEGSFQTPVYRVMGRVSDSLVKILLK